MPVLKYKTNLETAFPILDRRGIDRMADVISELPRISVERDGVYVKTSRKISKAEIHYLKGYSHGLAHANYDMID